MNYYLGIDGGGTKTTAMIVDEAGQELGRGNGGPSNIAMTDSVALSLALRASVQAASQAAGLESPRFANVCAGVAGFSLEARRAEFSALLNQEVNSDRYEVHPDYLTAYWGASEGEPGIVVIAGTGAVAFGRNAEGRTHKEDGYGYLLGDRGSGFNLGLYALRYTLTKMQENRTDELTEAVLRHTGARIQNEVLQWLYGEFSPARVASLAPLVGELAEAGNPAARTLVSEMARRLRHTVRSLRHTLWLPRDAPVYPLGGLWQLGRFFRAEFIEPTWAGHEDNSIENETLPGGRFCLLEPKHDAATGAALLALGLNLGEYERPAAPA